MVPGLGEERRVGERTREQPQATNLTEEGLPAGLGRGRGVLPAAPLPSSHPELVSALS